jgi:hypothetical protein
VVNEVIIDLLSGGSRPGGFAGGFPLFVFVGSLTVQRLCLFYLMSDI